MNRKLQVLWSSLVALLGLLPISACGPVRPPVPTGEIPPLEAVSQSDEQYGQEVLSSLTQQFPLENNDAAVNRVRDLVDRLAEAAGASRSPWNVFVLRGDDVVNAAATKGNYVFVWTGLLRVVDNDGELAAVVAHEMGHLLAGHTQPTPQEEARQITANVTGEVVGRIVASQGYYYGALGQLAGALTQELVKALIVNPESQRQELEADEIGVFLMADAGFDPREATSLWSRMSELSETQVQIPTFLSSHPGHEERLAQVEAIMPAALERYRTARELAGRDNTKAKRTKGSADTFVLDSPKPRKKGVATPSPRSSQLPISEGNTSARLNPRSE